MSKILYFFTDPDLYNQNTIQRNTGLSSSSLLALSLLQACRPQPHVHKTSFSHTHTAIVVADLNVWYYHSLRW